LVKRSIVRSLCASSVALFTVLVTPAASMAVDEFPLPAGSNPTGIIAGPDGALWFTEEGGNKIGRMTTGGVLTHEIPIPTAGSLPTEIAVGSDNKLWFTEFNGNKIGRVEGNGTICEFPVPGSGSQPDGIVAGPDGALWFTQFGSNQIGRIPTSATCGSGSSITEYGPTGSGPGDITVGPDGGLWFTESIAGNIRRIDPNPPHALVPSFAVPGAGSDPSGITASGGFLWFTQSGSQEIGRVTTGGTMTEFGPTGIDPSGIVTGPDQALWFTEQVSSSIGRITTSGSFTNSFATPTGGSEPSGIAAGPDTAVWFTEKIGNKIGRIAVSAGAPPPLPPPPPPPPPSTSKTKKCKVPKLRGLTVKKARRKLKRAKCKYKIRGKGRVRSTVPKAGRTTTKRVTVKCKRKKAKRTGRRATAGGRLIASKGGL
jgi:virginiamycin B lyase